jgi:hypothetical protein
VQLERDLRTARDGLAGTMPTEQASLPVVQPLATVQAAPTQPLLQPMPTLGKENVSKVPRAALPVAGRPRAAPAKAECQQGVQ